MIAIERHNPESRAIEGAAYLVAEQGEAERSEGDMKLHWRESMKESPPRVRGIVRNYYSEQDDEYGDCTCCPEEGWHQSYSCMIHDEDDRRTRHRDVLMELLQGIPDGNLFELTVRDLGPSRHSKNRWSMIADDPSGKYKPRPI